MTKKNNLELKVWLQSTKKISDLVEYDRNPRTITNERFEKLKQRIKSQGYRNPICLTHEGTILAGHQRYKALMDMRFGDLELPVMIPPKDLKLTEKLIQEIILTDNISWGDFDWDIISSDYEIPDLKNWGLDTSAIEPQEEKERKEATDNLEDFFVLVKVKDEFEQQEIFSEMQERGFECKLMN